MPRQRLDSDAPIECMGPSAVRQTMPGLRLLRRLTAIAMNTRPKRRAKSWLRHRERPLSNMQAAVLTGIGAAILVLITTVTVVRQERLLKYPGGEWKSLPWNPGWPLLPVVSGIRQLRTDIARAIYTFAGAKPEILRYIPCFCGCVSQGHQSNHDCYVKRRSTDGRVVEWDSHGLVCPLAPDITGDVMLWHEKGRPLSRIRNDIDREFRARGPATVTPEPPER